MYSGVVICVPKRQTPRRGDRLFDPATAAKEETAQHGSRVTRKPFIEQTCALNLAGE
jgi:hypothetical protein